MELNRLSSGDYYYGLVAGVSESRPFGTFLVQDRVREGQEDITKTIISNVYAKIINTSA